MAYFCFDDDGVVRRQNLITKERMNNWLDFLEKEIPLVSGLCYVKERCCLICDTLKKVAD